MGLFGKKSERRANETMTLEELISSIIGTDSISKEQALNIPSLASCVLFISNIVASLPIKLYRENIETEEVCEVTDDNRTVLLNDETGDTLSGYDMKKAFVQSLLLDGVGYIYMKKNRNMVESLHFVEKINVSPQQNFDPIFKSYDLLVNGKTYRDFEFIKAYRNTSDGIRGKGILEDNQKILSVAYSTLIYQTILLKTGGNKKGFLCSEKKASPEALTAIKASFKNLYSNNTENVVMLNEGIKFQESSATPLEMQLNESTLSIAVEVCKLFNLSPDIISGKCTDEESSNAIKTSITPVLTAIECALNKDLLLTKEKKSLYFAFDTKELLKSDIEKRYRAYQIAIQSNIMQIDEVRYIENLKPLGLDFVKIGLADVLFYPKTGMIYTPNTNKMSRMNEEKADVATDETAAQEKG